MTENVTNGPPIHHQPSASAKIRRPARRQGNSQPPDPAPGPGPAPGAQASAQQASQADGPPNKPRVGAQAIADLLNRKRDASAKFIPPGIDVTPDRLIQNALRMVLADRKLTLCDTVSIFESVLACASIGLDFISDLAYLIPHEWKEQDGKGNWHHRGWYCVFWPGYKGLVTVAARAGYALDVQEVRQNDRIEMFLGTDNIITHSVPFGPRGETTGVYCIVRNAEGRVLHVEPMNNEDLEPYYRDTPAWNNNRGEMSRKSVAKRACKWLPKDNKHLKLLAEYDARVDSQQRITDLVTPAPGSNPAPTTQLASVSDQPSAT